MQSVYYPHKCIAIIENSYEYIISVFWTGPSGTLNGTTPTGSVFFYTSVFSHSSLSASDAGTYTCNATAGKISSAALAFQNLPTLRYRVCEGDHERVIYPLG